MNLAATVLLLVSLAVDVTIRAEELPGLKALVEATQTAFAEADQPPAAPSVVVFTIDDERIAAPLSAIQDGQLVLASDPARRVPLDEIQRIEISHQATVAIRWLGQDNHDVVQTNGAAGSNGIQDMHAQLTGLPPAGKITQIVAVCTHPTRQGVWKLDTTNTPNWKLGMERAEDSDTADLYMEPNQDNFDQELNFTITYEDGNSVKVSTKITTHTDPQLKATKTEEPAASTPDSGPARVLVHLEAGNRLRGELVALTKESLRLRPAWGFEMEIPLLQSLGIEFGSTISADARQKFEQLLRNPGTEDTAFVRAQDQSITLVSGSIQDMADGKLRFTYQDEIRSINQPRLVALVFASHPSAQAELAPYQVFRLVSGDKIAGSWTAMDRDSFELRSSWGSSMRLPSALVSEVTFRNGKMVYLSDLEPASLEEVPYFGRLMTYRRDQSLSGEPLKTKGKTYSKGLAVHSRCVLTYAIDGRFQTLKSVVGFDDSAGGRGRVLCRVLGDGKELFLERDLRGDQEPKSLDVPIAGVKQLTLEIDFGEAEDTGDRVIWADARLFRQDKR